MRRFGNCLKKGAVVAAMIVCCLTFYSADQLLVAGPGTEGPNNCCWPAHPEAPPAPPYTSGDCGTVGLILPGCYGQSGTNTCTGSSPQTIVPGKCCGIELGATCDKLNNGNVTLTPVLYNFFCSYASGAAGGTLCSCYTQQTSTNGNPATVTQCSGTGGCANATTTGC